MTIATEIKKYIENAGVSQKSIATAVGTSKQSISQALNDKRKIKLDEYVCICDFLEVPYDTFVHSEQKEKL